MTMPAKAIIPSSTNSDGENPLFVKDCDDIFIQKSSSSSDDSGNSNPADGFRTSVYKHFESNMRVVMCRTSSPIYTLNIYVPTVAPNNKGLPHTLEHLVFCGSKRYPIRGYMDVLASYNYSVGTNAWTDKDHTCYTLSTLAEDGVANVLPPFLDHVLNPLLSDDHFVTEVYHYDETGKEKGVVFSEMGSKENKEDILAYYHLNKLVYNSSATYSKYSGGKTYDIARLTNKEIIDYHHKYYDANNVTVVLTGAFSDDFEEKYLQTIPADIIQSRDSDSREPMDCSPPDNNHPRYETVRFPSSDTSTGSFSFGWQGPKHEDVKTNIALDVMLEYLAGTSSSPLNLRFVERSSPLASSIETHIYPNVTTMLNLTFNGVSYTCKDPANQLENGSKDPDFSHLFEQRYFESLLIGEFKRLIDTQFDGDSHALGKAAKRLSGKLAADIEKTPGNALQNIFYPDIVASHFSPESQGSKKLHIGLRAKQFDIIDDLGKRPVEFWLGFLKEWLIDGTAYHAAMVPDTELGLKLELERKEIEQANAAKIVDKDVHAKYIKKAVDASILQVSEEVKKAIPTPDPTKATTLPHKQNLVTLDNAIGPVAAVQSINVDSGFAETQIQIPIGNIPEDQRAFLTLFEELLMETDILLPAGVLYDNSNTPLQTKKRVRYSEFESRMSDLVASRYSRFGQRSQLFSCNWLDNIFVIQFKSQCKNYLLALRWTVQGLLFSEFTLDRILTCSQNILARIAAAKRDIGSIASNLATHFTGVSQPGEPLTNRRHMSFLAQEGVLKNVIEKAKDGKVDEVIAKLRDIQSALIQATSGFIALSLPSSETPKPYVDTFAREWNMCYGKYDERNKAGVVSNVNANANAVVKEGPSPFPIRYDIMFPALTKPLLIHVPVSSLQTSHSLFSYKINASNCPTGRRSFDDELTDLVSLDYFALRMLLALLARIDGPLDNAVRGKGYAYGGNIYIAEWSKRLGLEIIRASDIVKAIGAVKQLFLNIHNNWDTIIGDSDVSLARSVIKYRYAIRQSTPAKMLDQSISNSIHGFANADEYNMWYSTHVAAVKMSDMRRMFEKYVLPFADTEYPMFRLLVTPSDVDVSAELGPFEQKTLEEISATYKADY
ncbi:hypothetical protein IWW48_005733 [Coemansia sp. RSA 1200]|nr:hypothetical protein IWW48_005733 [Coemansia sp. RSA 1200]